MDTLTDTDTAAPSQEQSTSRQQSVATPVAHTPKTTCQFEDKWTEDAVVRSAPHHSISKNWYTEFVYPVLGSVAGPEQANTIAKFALRIGEPLLRDRKPDPPSLKIKLWGRELSNPIGLAAGFDKDAEVYRQAGSIGFGLVEIGTVTPRYQAGNDKPRVFRLAQDFAAINRMGFPSKGLDFVKHQFDKNKDKSRPITGINIGANKESADRTADYVTCATALAPYADYLVCNVSSPNTPGLRSLQQREQLSSLIRRVQDATTRTLPLLVKIAPDVSDNDLDDIVEVGRKYGIDGLIVGNTTLSRPATLLSKYNTQSGGLSGAPLAQLSTDVLRRAARRVENKFVLVGCGGISSGADAYAKIRSGATFVQLYTSLMYEGPPLVRRIKNELAVLLAQDGFTSVSQAVGADL